METTQKARLLHFIELSGYSVREFERLLGVSEGTIRHLNDSLSANVKEKLSSKFPQLNQEWILYGMGDMLIQAGNSASGDGSVQNVGSNNNIGVPIKKFESEKEWFALVAEKDKQISRLLSIIEKMNKK